MTQFLFSVALGFAGGGAFVWVSKDTIMKWVVGAQALAISLETKAAVLKAAVKA